MQIAILAIAGVLTGSTGLYLESVLIQTRIERADSGLGPLSSLVPLAGSVLQRPQPVPEGDQIERSRGLPFWLQALVLQVTLGVLFVLFGVKFQHHTTHLVLACVYTALLFEMAIVDFHYRLVLNILSYPSAVIATAGAGLWSGIGFGSSLLGGVIAMVVFGLIELFGRGAMGRGDTKLATVIGLMRGFPAVWQAMIIGIFAGGLMAVGLLLSGQSRRSAFAYGPALAIGAVASFFVGHI
ncbi:MAG TPA: A24 family peptidase [Chloroflexota bacterium]|nr:A24 family peptidase [Chloroflexota bacterium]